MITSTSNQQIKQLTALLKKSKERKEKKLFVVEGKKMVDEVPITKLRAVYVSESYANNPANAQIIIDFMEVCASVGATYEVVADNVFKSVSDTQTPQGIMAVVAMPEYSLEQLLEGNKTTVDLYNPKTIRSTMGSIYRVPFFVTEDLAETIKKLREKGISLYAAHLKGEHAYDEEDYTEACGFLIGNEGNGLSDEIANLADTYIKIPMEGEVESLNAAISATLLMYETNRQRRKAQCCAEQ